MDLCAAAARPDGTAEGKLFWRVRELLKRADESVERFALARGEYGELHIGCVQVHLPRTFSPVLCRPLHRDRAEDNLVIELLLRTRRSPVLHGTRPAEGRPRTDDRRPGPPDGSRHRH